MTFKKGDWVKSIRPAMSFEWDMPMGHICQLTEDQLHDVVYLNYTPQDVLPYYGHGRFGFAASRFEKIDIDNLSDLEKVVYNISMEDI